MVIEAIGRMVVRFLMHIWMLLGMLLVLVLMLEVIHHHATTSSTTIDPAMLPLLVTEHPV